MTEAFKKWCKENLITDPAGTHRRLRAFVREVERRYFDGMDRKPGQPTNIVFKEEYERLVQELGLKED